MKQTKLNDPAVVGELRAKGPIPETELSNHVSIDDWEHGVRHLSLEVGTGMWKLFNDRHTSVYYLAGEHDEKLVLQVYIEANECFLQADRDMLSQCFAQFGSEFADAWEDIAGERTLETLDSGEQQSGTSKKLCPYCDRYVSLLPAHIRRNCPDAPE